MLLCDKCNGLTGSGYNCQYKNNIELRKSSSVYYDCLRCRYYSCLVEEEYNEWCEERDREEMEDMWNY